MVALPALVFTLAFSGMICFFRHRPYWEQWLVQHIWVMCDTVVVVVLALVRQQFGVEVPRAVDVLIMGQFLGMLWFHGPSFFRRILKTVYIGIVFIFAKLLEITSAILGSAMSVLTLSLSGCITEIHDSWP